jgi:Zn-dependent protease with chaperone function
LNTAIPVTSIPADAQLRKSWSMVAWTAIAAVSVILSYLITFILSLVSLLFGLLLLLEMLKTGLSFFGAIVAAFTFVMGGTVFWSLLPRKIPFETNGVPIDLARETRLRAEVEALAKALNEKMPDEVYLVPIANAGVLDVGKSASCYSVSRFCSYLPYPNPGPAPVFGNISRHPSPRIRTLLRWRHGDGPLGFPSAHEYGPSTHAAGRRFRRAFGSKPVGRRGHLASCHSRRLIALFNRLTQHVSRKREYPCDELACYLAGSGSLEQGLCSVNRASDVSHAGKFAAA